jgi:3-hydroxyacyl-CoA dehydrogenase
MSFPVRRVAVVGAGTMGAQIAAHFANVGIPGFLLDQPPTELNPEEASRGLTLAAPPVRNRIVTEAFNRAKALKPSPFFTAAGAGLVTLGNTADHLPWLAEADWIIEAVVERLPVKREVLATIEAHRRPGALVSSNTSGLSIAAMSEGRSEEFRAHFLGTHFFNPPRYLHLLEVIPTPATRPEVIDAVSDFGRRTLGKGIVVCKDTPYFIGNRIGCFAMSTQLLAAREEGLTIDEVDAITGPPMLRPRSATFRLNDIVGIDLTLDVGENLYAAVPDDPHRAVFEPPDWVREMVRRGWRGEKSGQGFYRRIRGESGSEILTLDLDTWEYRPRQRVRFPSLDAVREVADPAERLRTLLASGDRAARYAWTVLSSTLVYAAERAEEIADDLARIDDAMRWGWNWELGPFEQWDALGIAEVARRLEAEGRPVPPVAPAALAAGGRFYRREEGSTAFFHFDGSWRRRDPEPGVLILRDLKGQGKTVASNPDASLVDLGDGVLCLEFHNKVNSMGPGVLEMTRRAVREVEQNWEALVIGNDGRMFSAGANLHLLLASAQEGDWEEIERTNQHFQDTLMAVKCCARPVVAAPFQQALGGGCEIVLQSARVQASAETYIGLVELGVGLIPAGGGCKEIVIRTQETCSPTDPHADRWRPLRAAWEMIGTAKVSTSAAEAREMGLLRDHDGISINPRRHLGDAKALALSLARAGYQPYRPRSDIYVLGESALARFKMELHLMRRAGYISEHDQRLGTALATVLCGGDLTSPRLVTEQYLLDLEREQFARLCGEPKTQDRIVHMLRTGKPLRN